MPVELTRIPIRVYIIFGKYVDGVCVCVCEIALIFFSRFLCPCTSASRDYAYINPPFIFHLRETIKRK